MSDKPTFLERAARWTRFVIVAAIAVVLGLIVTTPRNEVPLTMSRAQAEGIGAAPGYLVTTLGANAAEKFYLIDTNNKVICVYSVNGDKLRLVAARKFDIDSDIWDASTPLKGIVVEGGNGVSRNQAKNYLEEFKVQMDKLEASKKPRK